jgi:hypothetical protein
MPFWPVLLSVRALTYLKYASMPRGIGAYSEAAPLSGKVPPMTIEFLVIPGTASGACVASVRANAPGRLTVSAAASARTANRTFFIRILLPDTATTTLR